MAKIALFVLCALFSISLAQNRRYRPFPAVTVVNNEGRYRGNNDGRYVSDNSGRYDANDGRYVPDESGRYNPDGSGVYSGSSGRYNPDGSGKYSGENGRYNGDGSGRYSGSNEKYQGDKYGAGNLGSGAGNSGSSAGSRFGAGIGASLIGGGISKPTAVKQGSAAGKYDNRNYAILRQEGTVEEDGYHYLYETENGITGEEQGKLHNRGTDEEAMKASGFFTYTGPDNVVYTVRYTADENGFIPEGDHLPTPPPIPEAIARALEYQRQQGTL